MSSSNGSPTKSARFWFWFTKKIPEKNWPSFRFPCSLDYTIYKRAPRAYYFDWFRHEIVFWFPVEQCQFPSCPVSVDGNEKAKQWIQEEKINRMHWSLPGKKGRRIWIHCSSLGEFEQGRPLIESIREHHHSAEIILNFFSPFRLWNKKNYPVVDLCFLSPNGWKPKFCKIPWSYTAWHHCFH